MLRSVEFPFLYSVPAFFAAVLIGSMSLGVVGEVENAWREGQLWQVPFRLGMYVLFALMFSPFLAALFFPAVWLLRRLRQVNWLSFLATGGGFGYLVFLWAPVALWSALVAGGIGGLAAFGVITACANRDVVST